MLKKDNALVMLMVETIEKILSYVSEINNAEELEKDTKSFDATIMNFIALGECVGKLTDEFRDKYPEINWRKIYAFRNVLAHDYFGILPQEVWEIIKNDLPLLKNSLQSILDSK